MNSLLQLTDTQISTWVASFMLPLFRVAALLMTMPLFGTTMVPQRVRLYMAVAITVVIAPALPPMPSVMALDLSTALLVAEEIIIGTLMGFTLQFLFQAFVVSGQIIAVQMGMSFAAMIDPVNGVSSPVIGQFFTMLVSLLFLSMNAHLVVFEVLVDSFTTLPPGGALLHSQFWDVVMRMSWVLSAGLMLVLPAITALLVVNVAFGVMTRAAPQLNIFSIGVPLTLVIGMVILWLTMGDILNQYQPLASDSLQWMRELVRDR